jgi:FimV-like protein
VEIETRPLPTADLAAGLGALALQVRGPEGAEKFFAAAIAADASHGGALVGTGDLHKFAGRFAAAKPYYERAIALEPENAHHLLDYAEYFLDFAGLEADAARRAELLREARRQFMRSYRIDPDNPETLAMNGASYLLPGEDAAKGVQSLEAAHDLLPSHRQIRVLLARAYVAAGEPEKARAHLETLLAWAHAESAEEIRELLASLGPGPSGGASGD